MNWITHFLICLLSFIIIFIGFYLWFHRKKKFLVFYPQKNPSLSIFLSIFGILLVITGLTTLITSLVGNLITFLVMMIFDAFLIMILTFILFLYFL